MCHVTIIWPSYSDCSVCYGRQCYSGLAIQCSLGVSNGGGGTIMYCILTNGCFVCICCRVPIAVDLIFSKRVFGFFILWSGFCFLLTAVSLSDRLKLWEAGVIIADFCPGTSHYSWLHLLWQVCVCPVEYPTLQRVWQGRPQSLWYSLSF